MKQAKEQTFSELIRGDQPVLADFYANWCEPCKMMNPILKDLKKRMGDQITIIKINAEKNAAASIKYQVKGIPTLILFKNGKVLWQKAGVIQAPQLQAVISQKLHNPEMASNA